MSLYLWNLFFQSLIEHFKLVLPLRSTFSVYSCHWLYVLNNIVTYQNNITLLKVSLDLVPRFSSLKCCKHFLPLSFTKLVWRILKTSPLLSIIHAFFQQVCVGGMTTLVFELSSCIGLNGTTLLTSPVNLQVISQELLISSTSTNNVRRDSSLRPSS